MTGSDEDHGRSRRPGAEDQRWSSIGRVLKVHLGIRVDFGGLMTNN
jgi:hypothetical protein